MLGGRIKYFKKAWKNITSDREILEIVLGISFPFQNFVRQVKVPQQLPMSPELEEFTTKEIHTLLQNGSIEEIQEIQLFRLDK